MKKKLILPAEVKICATCSFWDGDRKVDPELALVVIEQSCVGECLAQNKLCQGLNDEPEWRDNCLWEHLAPDAPESSEWTPTVEAGFREQETEDSPLPLPLAIPPQELLVPDT
ncbi:MAG: hypothetical protein LBS49_01150 [Candidatus Accumulibacter sp.]|jgi:hypothetical protein|nr:hypothetical protein [Accumulibacter sp.]